MSLILTQRWARAVGVGVMLVVVTGPSLLGVGRLSALAASPLKVSGNVPVDFDHGTAFPKNKQNEAAITRDPVSGALIAGANDEYAQPLCAGTTQPLTSPCPFAAGVPTSAYYVSNNNGQTWSGGYLPGFNTIG